MFSTLWRIVRLVEQCIIWLPFKHKNNISGQSLQRGPPIYVCWLKKPMNNIVVYSCFNIINPITIGIYQSYWLYWVYDIVYYYWHINPIYQYPNSNIILALCSPTLHKSALNPTTSPFWITLDHHVPNVSLVNAGPTANWSHMVTRPACANCFRNDTCTARSSWWKVPRWS